jgi:hypothetical protein
MEVEIHIDQRLPVSFTNPWSTPTTATPITSFGEFGGDAMKRGSPMQSEHALRTITGDCRCG